MPAPEHALPRRSRVKRNATSLEESSLHRVRFRLSESGRDGAETLRVPAEKDG